ncbi:rRNA maturation RNase YbeY [Candidatus Peregrinibacteria bacterium HGW-Peregrinibacteria-1]|jgi:probable rRNA maturation factor|nr:MAG: rRNA maturation RNase YbeY [Candidatus Peregrinibacteria bacterium HGW-Peregrinibacteria-1]
MIKLLFSSKFPEVEKNIFEDLMSRINDVMKEDIDERTDEREGVINLMIVDDDEIREINRDYRGYDKPTDVISFEYFSDGDYWIEESDELEVGDIFISIDTARRQSVDKNHTLDKEFEILFVHGVLHVLGYDHNDDEEEQEMEGYAKEILVS